MLPELISVHTLWIFASILVGLAVAAAAFEKTSR